MLTYLVKGVYRNISRRLSSGSPTVCRVAGRLPAGVAYGLVLAHSTNAYAQFVPPETYYVIPTMTTVVVPCTQPTIYYYPSYPVVRYAVPTYEVPTYVAPTYVLPTYVSIERDVRLPSRPSTSPVAIRSPAAPSLFANPDLRTGRVPTIESAPVTRANHRPVRTPVRTPVRRIETDFAMRTRDFERSKTDLLRALNASLQTVKRDSLEDNVESIVLLIQVTEAVVGDSPNVERAHLQYIEQATQYVADLRAMVHQLTIADNELESFARIESNGDIKESYLQSARLINAWKDRVDDTIDDTQRAIAAVRDNYEYTVSIGTMLRRLLKAIKTMEGLPSPVDSKMLKNPLIEFVQHTEKLKNAIPQLTDRLESTKSTRPAYQASRS